MKRLALVVPVLVLLLAPAAVEAKGTNVRISSAPNGTDAGEPWTALISITMPGQGAVNGVRPKVVIRRGVMRRSFAARPTARMGVYRARVVFPSRGEWRYGVDDGLADRMHGFPPVRIAPDEPPLAAAPLPISGEVHEPEAVLSPETIVSHPERDADGGPSGGLTIAFTVAGLGAVGAAVIIVRRRRAPSAGTPSGSGPSASAAGGRPPESA